MDPRGKVNNQIFVFWHRTLLRISQKCPVKSWRFQTSCVLWWKGFDPGLVLLLGSISSFSSKHLLSSPFDQHQSVLLFPLKILGLVLSWTTAPSWGDESTVKLISDTLFQQPTRNWWMITNAAFVSCDIYTSILWIPSYQHVSLLLSGPRDVTAAWFPRSLLWFLSQLSSICSSRCWNDESVTVSSF